MMMRGNVWWINFDPSIGGEIRKKRPAVIVSNDAANHYLNRVQVVPITSNVDKLYPSEAYVTFRGKKAKAMADQITTVSKQRLINSAGSVSNTEMEAVGKAITTQLDL
ncbi:MAG: type II toxin-antitoxin system PemK/MazF family toxin [Desulfobacterales bacterium]